MLNRTSLLWLLWIVLTVGGGLALAGTMYVGGDRSSLVIGETSAAHHQIELACDSCHTGGVFENSVEVNLAMNDACLSCHQDELKVSNDSHPVRKFKDPRNAAVRDRLDALFCTSCHAEHVPEITNVGAVTQALDFCFACHEDIGEERESHVGLEFDTCASAGCHNFHDNTALYEDFLTKHAGKAEFLDNAIIQRKAEQMEPIIALKAALKDKDPVASLTAYLESTIDPNAPTVINTGYSQIESDGPPNPADLAKNKISKVLTASMAIAPEVHKDEASVTAWDGSGHALAGVNCAGCHTPDMAEETNLAKLEANWIESPTIEVCASCHTDQAATFVEGKHGMTLHPKLAKPREAQNAIAKVFSTVFKDEAIEPMSVAKARLKMHDSAADKMIGNCNSCHLPHEADIEMAAAASCSNCHADEHSTNYFESTHFDLWQQEIKGEIPVGSGVSCATCHMPKLLDSEDRIFTTHNQNSYLRPNEKMIRTVCLSCHSIEFTIDALADPELVKAGFNGRPSSHIESVDWSLNRVEGGR